MSNTTYEGVVDNGHIRLLSDVRLPEQTKVVITVADTPSPRIRIASPRLVHPEQVADFQKQVIEDEDDAAICLLTRTMAS